MLLNCVFSLSSQTQLTIWAGTRIHQRKFDSSLLSSSFHVSSDCSKSALSDLCGTLKINPPASFNLVHMVGYRGRTRFIPSPSCYFVPVVSTTFLKTSMKMFCYSYLTLHQHAGFWWSFSVLVFLNECVSLLLPAGLHSSTNLMFQWMQSERMRYKAAAAHESAQSSLLNANLPYTDCLLLLLFPNC